MMQVSGFLSGLIPVVTLLIGAGLQFLSTHSLDSGKQLRLERGQAYADYFRALSISAVKGKSLEAQTLATDAKTRICVYGSPAVVNRLADFERLGAMVGGAESRTAIAELLKAMRRDMDGRARSLDTAALDRVIFQAK
ncbi:hypothetical protein [Phenylobacterium aquaticum]|uniref:hypothetical protein n=1 Tax=Phenylobacterium aquaticum TaxID=1763816 RepID=UPI0026EE5CBE|nr:hypothetical protein [Phenylobacterium aquaticum]